MSKLSVPIRLGKKFNKEKTLKELKRIGANRVFLAIGIPYFDRKKRAESIKPLEDSIKYFKDNGLEVGVWLWTFWRGDPENAGSDMERITGFEGQTDSFFCPTSESFIKDTCELLCDIAKLDPDIIMFDDDYRFGWLPSGIMGCLCKNHLAMMENKLKEPITERKDFIKKVFNGGENKYRDAYLDSLGDSLRNFAKSARAAVDSVNKDIRIALCSVMSVWDEDGTDAIEISKLLAGNTKPLLRFIGAPYWAVNKSYNCRLHHVIETERMESSWCEGVEIETMTEGDTYPRPRYQTPASYLECFDTALKAANAASGSFKYMYDYLAEIGYEPEYAKIHLENEALYKKIEDIFSRKKDIGIRIYESMKKIRTADFPVSENINKGAIENLFFSISAKVLSDNTIPTTYTQNTDVGIVFGENARHLPKEALGTGLMLDIKAAKILMEKGINVGIEDIGIPKNPKKIYYKAQDEYTSSYYAENNSYFIKPKANAEILAYSTDDDEMYPDTVFYENDKGQKFVVFGFDASSVNEGRYRSYCMQNLLHDCYVMLSGKAFPFICKGNPDLYMIAREDENEAAIGLWNICADKISKPIITLDREYSDIECIGCTGKLNGKTIELSPIHAYEYSFILLKK